MLKALIAIVVLALLGTFTYFFVADKSGAPTKERAQQAALQTKDAVVDQGVAIGVNTRLAAAFGIDAAGYLHVSNRGEGVIWVYGMLRPGITEEQVLAEAGKAPGVKDVKVMVIHWPQGAPELPETPNGTPTAP